MNHFGAIGIPELEKPDVSGELSCTSLGAELHHRAFAVTVLCKVGLEVEGEGEWAGDKLLPLGIRQPHSWLTSEGEDDSVQLLAVKPQQPWETAQNVMLVLFTSPRLQDHFLAEPAAFEVDLDEALQAARAGAGLACLVSSRLEVLELLGAADRIILEAESADVGKAVGQRRQLAEAEKAVVVEDEGVYGNVRDAGELRVSCQQSVSSHRLHSLRELPKDGSSVGGCVWVARGDRSVLEQPLVFAEIRKVEDSGLDELLLQPNIRFFTLENGT